MTHRNGDIPVTVTVTLPTAAAPSPEKRPDHAASPADAASGHRTLDPTRTVSASIPAASRDRLDRLRAALLRYANRTKGRHRR